MVGTRHSFDFQDDDDAEHLVSAGKALLAPPKGKDQLLRTLKASGGHGGGQGNPWAPIAAADNLPAPAGGG